MLNLLTSEQIRATDKHTIIHQPIASIDLMERAALAFSEAFIKNFSDKRKSIAMYCGTGNNGGDGLAIARILYQAGYTVDVKIARFSGKSTKEFDGNLARLMAGGITFDEFRKISELGSEKADIIIDALLGSGLNKPLKDEWLALVEWINSLGKTVVAVDIPTGFNAEGPVSKHDVTIKSNLTITFQRPKINMLLPESAFCIKQFEVVDIGLDEAYIQSLNTAYLLLTDRDISLRLKMRIPFSHKGTYGHALIIAGSTNTMGAALLCAEACLHTGAGLITACIPADGLIALNVRVPEVMTTLRYQNELPADLIFKKYNAIAIGPGLGTSNESLQILKHMLKSVKKAIVADADALNMLSSNQELIEQIPEGSVLTPHVKEFDRLFGEHANWWERLETGRQKAEELKIVIVLKNRYTIIFTPEGKCIFNPTGTSAMATAGMGDVLTGMIAAFIAQGYKAEDAAILGVFIHGKAGYDLASQNSAYVVTASQLSQQIAQTIGKFI